MGNKVEEICVQRFLNWYNGQYKGHYIHQRATTHFPDLNKNNEGDWDFVAYERDDQEEWVGIEVKEYDPLRVVNILYKFWEDLCLELTQDLTGRETQGEFDILPPVVNLRPRDRLKFREAFTEVLCSKASNIKVNEVVDIGPDIWAKFAKWPEEKSKNLDEYNKFGGNRPAELQITKRVDSGCKVALLTNPIVVYDVPEKHRGAFDEADIKHANEQLKLAKERRARKTILLFACSPFVYEYLVKNALQSLDRHLISDIDYIYLVSMGSKNVVIKVYPN